MVKTHSVRHSKSRKDPVTIDLEASAIASDSTVAQPDDALRPEVDAVAEPSLLDDPRATAGEATIVEGAGFTMSEPESSSDTSPNEPAALSGEASQTSIPAASASAESKRENPLPSDGSTKTTKPEPRRGGISAVAAGIIGGIITLAGAGALQYGGLLPSPGAGGGDSAAVEGLRGDIAGLQSEIAALKAGGGDTGSTQTIADLQTRMETLTQDLGTLKSAVESGGAGENAGIAALDAKLAELQTRIDQASTAAPVDLAPLSERIATLGTAVKSATDTAAAGDTRLTALEQTVASLAGKVEAQADQPKIALSIASSALKAAIDRGQPFAAELETLAAIAPDLPQIGDLRAHAETGVPTRDAILAEVDSAANAMIAAASPGDPNAGYFDQLLNSAASLVTVRPVGAVQGEGVPETTARIEAALRAGDLNAALAEYATLPDAAKAAGSAFAGKIKARLDVETLVDQAIAEAMKTV